MMEKLFPRSFGWGWVNSSRSFHRRNIISNSIVLGGRLIRVSSFFSLCVFVSGSVSLFASCVRVFFYCVYMCCMRSCPFFIPPHVCVYVFVCVEVVRSYVCLCVCVYSCVCMRSACLYLRMCLYLYCAFLCVCVFVYMCVGGFACVWLRRVFVCIVRSSRSYGSSRTDRKMRIRYKDSLRDVICVRPPPSPSALQ